MPRPSAPHKMPAVWARRLVFVAGSGPHASVVELDLVVLSPRWWGRWFDARCRANPDADNPIPEWHVTRLGPFRVCAKVTA